MYELLLYLERPIGILASALIFAGQLTYIIGTWRKKISPSLLSWYGWALLMLTLVYAQFREVGWEWSLASVGVTAIGCLFIALTAQIRASYNIQKRDWWFLLLGVICMILYLISHNPWLTTIYVILADFIIGIPTLIKVWSDPSSERTPAWLISVATWSLTLLISFNHDIMYAVFPIYLWLYCVYLVYLVYLRKKTKN